MLLEPDGKDEKAYVAIIKVNFLSNTIYTCNPFFYAITLDFCLDII